MYLSSQLSNHQSSYIHITKQDQYWFQWLMNLVLWSSILTYSLNPVRSNLLYTWSSHPGVFVLLGLLRNIFNCPPRFMFLLLELCLMKQAKHRMPSQEVREIWIYLSVNLDIIKSSRQSDKSFAHEIEW